MLAESERGVEEVSLVVESERGVGEARWVAESERMTILPEKKTLLEKKLKMDFSFRSVSLEVELEAVTVAVKSKTVDSIGTKSLRLNVFGSDPNQVTYLFLKDPCWKIHIPIKITYATKVCYPVDSLGSQTRPKSLCHSIRYLHRRISSSLISDLQIDGALVFKDIVISSSASQICSRSSSTSFKGFYLV